MKDQWGREVRVTDKRKWKRPEQPAMPENPWVRTEGGLPVEIEGKGIREITRELRSKRSEHIAPIGAIVGEVELGPGIGKLELADLADPRQMDDEGKAAFYARRWAMTRRPRRQ